MQVEEAVEKENLVDGLKDYRDMLVAHEELISIVSSLDHDTAIWALATAINTHLRHRGCMAHVVIKSLVSYDSLK